MVSARGKIKDKECPEEAVVREVEEEVGLAVVPIKQVADFGDHSTTTVL